MKKYIKITISFLMVIALLQPTIIKAREENIKNPAFEKALSFMTGLSLITQNDKSEVSTVTRAEFASYMFSAMGLSNGTDVDENTKQSYLGYTDNPEYDENGDWIWKTEEERESENIHNTETPFKDVSSTHKYWDKIRLAAQLGIMRGDDNKYFRPDEAITGYEMIKVLTEACGAKLFAQGNYPFGYLAQAKKLKITNDISSAIGDYPVSYATVVVGLYNALNSEVYVPETYNSNGKEILAQKDGYTLLEYWRGIKYVEGIVKKNKNTGIENAEGFGDECIEVNEKVYQCDQYRSDELLGMKIKLYYKEDGGIYNTKYIEKMDCNKELVIDSKDINRYTNPYLSYTLKDSDKAKQIYIGADTNIIYNGKLILDYSDDIFDFNGARGNIRFLDADSDGKYEMAFVSQSELFWIDMIDYNNKIVYDKLSTAISTLPNSIKGTDKKINLNEGSVVVLDADGNELSVDNLLTDMVLYVQRTLPSQGESVTKLICSSRVLTGTVTAKESDTVVINGSEYELLDIVDAFKIELGSAAEFYLTPDGKIAAFKSQKGLQLGYLVKLADNGNPFSDDIRAKIYIPSSDSMLVCKLTDKITYNKSKMDVGKAAKQSEIYNLAENKTISQPIKFKINSDGELCEILTGNYDAHEFYTERLESPWLGYRSYGMLYTSKPMYYAKVATKYVNVPKNDDGNEKSYYLETLRHNEFQGVNIICKDDIDSNYVSALFKESDSSNVNEVSSSAGVYMVSEIAETVNDEGDSFWKLTARTASNSTTAGVYKSELENICKDLEPGDLVRLDLGGNPYQVLSMKKVFDVGEKCLMSVENPSDSSIVAESFYIHGSATGRTDDGDIVNVTPYIYSSSGGKIQKTLAENNATNNYPFFAKKFGLLVFYTDRGTIEAGSYSADILTQDSTGKENDIIVCTRWGDPIGMFLYK